MLYLFFKSELYFSYQTTKLRRARPVAVKRWLRTRVPILIESHSIRPEKKSPPSIVFPFFSMIWNSHFSAMNYLIDHKIYYATIPINKWECFTSILISDKAKYFKYFKETKIYTSCALSNKVSNQALCFQNHAKLFN